MRRILLMDIDRESSRSTRCLLTSYNEDIDCEEVATQQAALKRIDTQRYDAVLLDLTRLESNGIDAIAQIRRRAALVPIIVLAQAPDTISEDAAVASGADDYLVKDETFEKLLRRSIGYAIDKKQKHARQTGEGPTASSDPKDGFRIIADNIPVDVVYVDTDERVRFINAQATKRFGRPRSEILGKTLFEILGPSWQAVHESKLVRAIGGEKISETLRSVLPNRTDRIVDLQYIPHLSADNTILGVYVLTADVTERETSAKALRKSEARYRSIIDTMAETYYETDDTGKLTFVSPAVTEVLGYTPNEVVGRDLAGLYTDPAKRIEFLKVLGENGGVTRDYLVELRRKDGTNVWISGNSRYLYGDDGTILGITGTIRDATKRMEAVNELRQRQAFLRSITDNLPVSIAYFDADLKYRFVNRTTEIWYRRSSSDMLGKGQEALNNATMYEPTASAEVLSGKRTHSERHIAYPDGLTRWVELTRIPDFDDRGNVRGYFRLAIDISERKEAELKLRESESLLRTIADNLPAMMAYTGADMRVRFMNRQLQERVAVSASEIAGRHARDVLGAEVFATVEPEIEAALRGKERRSLQRRVRPDGTVRWFDAVHLPDRDVNGTIRGCLMMAIDVTENRQAVLKLRESETRLRLITDNIPASICYIDADGKYQFANRTNLLWNRRTIADIVGRSAREIRGANWTDQIDRDIDRALAGEICRIEQTVDYADGKTRLLDVTYLPDRSDDGAVVGFYVFATDISERKAAEVRLRESEMRLRLIADNIPAAIAYVDAEGRHVFVNRTNAQWNARPYSDLIGRTIAEIRGPESAEHFRFNAERARAGEVIRFERTATYRDGKTRSVEVAYVPEINDDGILRGFYIFAMDISERKAAEEALLRSEERLWQAQKIDALGQLTSGIAHDFNNLLSVIAGTLELVDQKLENAPFERDLVKHAATAAEHGAQLVSRLLAFSRQQVLNPEIVDIEQTMAPLADILRPTLDAGIAIATEIKGPLWKCNLDPAQLQTALLNLAVNARDAMPSGGKLTFAAANFVMGKQIADEIGSDRLGGYVRIAISDTGTGMTPEVVRRVFEPFYTTKEIGKGTGLGLSMVYGFVQQSGGHIRILSAPNEGTTIELYFPADEASDEAPEMIERRRAKPDTPPLRKGNGELILLVDDDPFVRETMAAFLKRLNYTIIEAENGHVALAKLSDTPAIVAMLSDIGLPDGMNGFDLAREAARRHPNVKMLFMSGLADNYKEGPNELPSGAVLMSKPFRMADLGVRLSDLLGAPEENTG